jgi:hypothetical protein
MVHRVEKRRFVGREFLLWLWFETEANEATLHTKKHGSFGMWVEKNLVLSNGKEITRIKGTQPGHGREAKEALLLGKMPESCGLHVSWREQESTFSLKAEQMALGGLSLPTVLGKDEDLAPKLLGEAPFKKSKKKRDPKGDPSDEAHEAFYERMRLTREVEEIVEELYATFLALRTSTAWETQMVPKIRAWARGKSERKGMRARREGAAASRTEYADSP